LPYGGSTVALRFCDIFASRKIARCPYDFYDHSTGSSRCSHGCLTEPVRYVQSYTNIVRAPFGHPEVPVRHPQSVSSKIYKRRLLTRNFSQAPYGVLKYVTTYMLRSPRNRTMSKNENRTISPLTKLSYGARRICDWAISSTVPYQNIKIRQLPFK